MTSKQELAKHTSKDDCWIAIHNKIYNISKFLDEHPGGEEVLLEEAGKDATESFEDVGHSEGARDMLKEYLVGPLLVSASDAPSEPEKKTAKKCAKPSQNSAWIWVALGLGFGSALTFYIWKNFVASGKN